MEFLKILGIPALLATIIPLILNRIFQKNDKRAQENNKTELRLTEMENRYKTLADKDSEIISILNQMREEFVSIKKANQSLLRDRMIQMHRIYYKEKKYIPIHEKDSFCNMANEYHALGKNGVMDKIIDEVMSLSTEPIN